MIEETFEIRRCNASLPCTVQESMTSALTNSLNTNNYVVKTKFKKMRDKVGKEETYSPEIKLSPTFVKKPPSEVRPPHFLERFPFFPDDLEDKFSADFVFAPPRPTQIRPSAVPTATAPCGESAKDVIKGGSEEMPGASAGSGARGRVELHGSV